MYSKVNQIRYELEKLYELEGLSNEVLELSRKLDKEIYKIQKKLLKNYLNNNIPISYPNVIHNKILDKT